MARIKNGLLGGISGNVGNVEGYVRCGVPMVRAKKRKSKVAPSYKQLFYRKGMSVVNKFINSMTRFVGMGFEGAARGLPQTANNLAKSYQLLNALHGDYPDIKILYPAVRLTEGDIQLPNNPQALAEGNGIRFTWDYDPIENWDDRRAQAMVLIHAEETGKSYTILTGARFSEQTELIQLSPGIKGKQLHAYLSFVSDDRKSISNSIYLGSLVL